MVSGSIWLIVIMLTNSVPAFLSIWRHQIVVHAQEDDPLAAIILDRLADRPGASRQPAGRLLRGFFVLGLDENEPGGFGQIADPAYVNDRSPEIEQEGLVIRIDRIKRFVRGNSGFDSSCDGA